MQLDPHKHWVWGFLDYEFARFTPFLGIGLNSNEKGRISRGAEGVSVQSLGVFRGRSTERRVFQLMHFDGMLVEANRKESA